MNTLRLGLGYPNQSEVTFCTKVLLFLSYFPLIPYSSHSVCVYSDTAINHSAAAAAPL